MPEISPLTKGILEILGCKRPKFWENHLLPSKKNIPLSILQTDPHSRLFQKVKFSIESQKIKSIFSQLEVNYAHKPNFPLLGAMGGGVALAENTLR